jgi:hypothetical protein
VPKESFWHLVTHFVYDVTHFDSKFFSSVRYLLFRPGFLSSEYLRGKRVSYLNPIKMYVFISAVFFLFFFSVSQPSSIVASNNEENHPKAEQVKTRIESEIRQLEKEIRKGDATASGRQEIQSYIQMLQQDLLTLKDDTSKVNELNYYRYYNNLLYTSGLSKGRDYDSIQKNLPPDKRDSWLKRVGYRKIAQISGKYKDQNEILENLFEKFRHSFPQLLFVSLPLIALLLKLLYIRRKQYFYADHVIFLVHLYCAMFVLMFFAICFSHFEDTRYLTWLRYLVPPVVIYMIWYQYKSLRNFYDQNRRKTVLKYVLLLLTSSLVMSMLFLLFLGFSILNM